MTYQYDAWSRLKEATAGPVGTPTWKLGWDYDRFGNRKNQNVTLGTGPSSQLDINPSTNRITTTGYSYDASGNLTNDFVHTYVYDAENRITLVDNGATATYSYDGSSLRVKKVAGSTTTVYVLSGSKVLAEYVNGATPANPTREYIYSGSTLLATLEGSALTYHHKDLLSTRLATDSSGTVVRTFGHFPFGEAWYETGAAEKFKFTSYERDDESGLDYAVFRFRSPRLGRFLSPDPMSGQLGNPQSLNRYSYVSNDPINFMDPMGLTQYYVDGMWIDPFFAQWFLKGFFTGAGDMIDHIEVIAPWNTDSWHVGIRLDVTGNCEISSFDGLQSENPAAYRTLVNSNNGNIDAARAQFNSMSVTQQATFLTSVAGLADAGVNLSGATFAGFQYQNGMPSGIILNNPNGWSLGGLVYFPPDGSYRSPSTIRRGSVEANTRGNLLYADIDLWNPNSAGAPLHWLEALFNNVTFSATNPFEAAMQLRARGVNSGVNCQ
jgi:RHS repeat-associated protein